MITAGRKYIYTIIFSLGVINTKLGKSLYKINKCTLQ